MITTESISEHSLTVTARLINALADPARLRIANLIRHGGEVCNCQIEPITGYLPSKISRHLALLKQADLLSERRKGTFIYYHFREAENPLVESLLALLDAAAAADPLLAADRKILTENCKC